MVSLGYSLTFCTRSIKLTSCYRDDSTFLSKIQNISSKSYQSHIFTFWLIILDGNWLGFNIFLLTVEPSRKFT